MERKYGKVIKGLGGLYDVRLPDGSVLQCRARGVLRRDEGKVLVGDTVTLSLDGENTVIEAIEPRRNSLIRPPLSNLDILYVVAAAARPAPVCETLDKLIAIAEHNGISVVLVITKEDIDRAAAESLRAIYAGAGVPTFLIDGEGACTALLSHIEKSLTGGKTAALAGASGVGKSTLMNRLFPDLSLATGDISQKIQRGKHTTRHVELFVHGGGYIADTPGFSLLDFVHFDFFDLSELFDGFREFAPYAAECRYADCTHTRETECGITAAVRRGKIAASRHASYVTLYDTLKAKKNYR